MTSCLLVIFTRTREAASPRATRLSGKPMRTCSHSLPTLLRSRVSLLDVRTNAVFPLVAAKNHLMRYTSASRVSRCPCTGHQTSPRRRSPRPAHSPVLVPSIVQRSGVSLGSICPHAGPQAHSAGFPWQGTPAPSAGAQQDRERKFQVVMVH